MLGAYSAQPYRVAISQSGKQGFPATETCQINPPNSLQLEIEQTNQNATKAVAFSI
jgi:hypothetical protein